MSRAARLAEQYDLRVPFAFATMGEPDAARGTQRYRGPALAGKVRCPNVPQSMRLSPAHRPTTTCHSGKPCACGTTVTLGPDDVLHVRQHHIFGTTTWRASYGRRTIVEPANANLKFHHLRDRTTTT